MESRVTDFLIRIKNASMARRRELFVPFSKLVKEIAKTLVKEKFLDEVKEENVGGKKNLKIVLRYEKREPVFTDVELLSKPSLRVYMKAHSLPDLRKKGIGISIISTSQGIMTGKEAIKKKLGGELLFRVW